MVVIRLRRAGSKKRPFYHLSVADSRHPRDGRFIERVGFFNPVAQKNQERFRINSERVDYWISKGAQPSERVAHLIKQHATSIANSSAESNVNAGIKKEASKTANVSP